MSWITSDERGIDAGDAHVLPLREKELEIEQIIERIFHEVAQHEHRHSERDSQIRQ